MLTNDSLELALMDCKRLALELECLLLSVDLPAVSKWWDSANEALEQHRAFMVQMQGDKLPIRDTEMLNYMEKRPDLQLISRKRQWALKSNFTHYSYEYHKTLRDAIRAHMKGEA